MATLIRTPWVPKYLDTYWFWDLDGEINFQSFTADADDLFYLQNGNCFKTIKECRLHPEAFDRFAAMRKEYTECAG